MVERYPKNHAAIQAAKRLKGTGKTCADLALRAPGGGTALNIDVALFNPLVKTNRRCPGARIWNKNEQGGGVRLRPLRVQPKPPEPDPDEDEEEKDEVRGEEKERRTEEEKRGWERGLRDSTEPWKIAMCQPLEFEARKKVTNYGPYYGAFIPLVLTAFGGQCETAKKSMKALCRWAVDIEEEATSARSWLRAEMVRRMGRLASFAAVRAWHHSKMEPMKIEGREWKGRKGQTSRSARRRMIGAKNPGQEARSGRGAAGADGKTTRVHEGPT